jgi:hypothetical protein
MLKLLYRINLHCYTFHYTKKNRREENMTYQHHTEADLATDKFSVRLVELQKSYGTRRKASAGCTPPHSFIFVTEAFSCRQFSGFPLLAALISQENFQFRLPVLRQTTANACPKGVTFLFRSRKRWSSSPRRTRKGMDNSRFTSMDWPYTKCKQSALWSMTK